ncbi:TonB-dependent siderophore receptor family protein 22 [Pseudomonas sp. StFLB209]|uniref:TonB-dependent siderophore receptor n=1 Tax=Pseudomonas sp. StFLB209 TaxID=1028989 RepID=UPI0004F59E7D|nr:TonB-dependent receptor [Pseudomonas sp. StFLB209]BAP43372.1 TonB-dependent siderophore receptor family protein 22 [Pseudomonas sp. StFLB209]
MPSHTSSTLTPLATALRMRHAFRARLPVAGLGLMLSMGMAAQVQAQELNLDIPAQPLDKALQAFADQANIQVLYSPSDVQNLRSTLLRGRYTVEQSVPLLLQGTNIKYQLTGSTLTLLAPGSSAAHSVELSPLNIDSNRLGMTTEGTQSYTTGATSTATRMNLSLRQTPQSVSVITRQQMDDQNLVSLDQVMRQTPGVTVHQENSEGSVFHARGFQIYNFQYDGVPSLPTDGGNVRDNYSIGNSVIYDRIEVLKGATGLVNSAGYPSGVINMVRKRPTRDFKGHVAASAGSWDNYRTEVDVSGPLTEGGSLRGRAVASTGLQNSFIDYLESEKNIFYGVLEADLSPNTTVSAGYDFQKNNNDGSSNNMHPAFYSNGTPIHLSRSFNAADKYAYRNQETQRAFADIVHTLDNGWELKATANYRQYQSRELINGLTASGIVNATTNQISHGFYSGGATIFNTDTDEKSFDLQAKGPFSLFGRTHDFVIGYNYADSEAVSRRFDNDSTATSVNVFTWDNNSPLDRSAFEWWSNQHFDVTQKIAFASTVLKPTDDLNIILGVRVMDYDWELNGITALNRRTNNFTTVTGETIPYAGITYDLDEHHTVYASYSDVFKPQAYSFDSSDKQLDPLTGKSYEIGAKGEYFDGRLNTSAALFVIKQDNVAQVDPNFSGLTPNGNTAYVAIQGVTTKGLELEASGELSPGWQIHTGYTYQESHDAKGNRAAVDQPQHLVKLATYYRLPDEWSKFSVGGNINWQSMTFLRQTVAGASRKFEQDAYATVGLNAGYDITKNLKTSVAVENLFDKTYYSGLNTVFRGGVYYGNPRNVMFNVRYEF